MIYIYTGHGKGKTTAAIGQTIRALGHKKKVCLIQLFKRKEYYGEQKILRNLKNLDFFSFAPRHLFCNPHHVRTDVRNQCKKALNCLDKILKSKKYNLIILDEFNIAIRDAFIKTNELLNILRAENNDADIIITGRSAPKKLVKIANLVTEFKEIKHPYKNGIKPKPGIEY